MKDRIKQLFPNAQLEVLTGLTVALALVPEAIAFAFVAKVDPLVGLFAAVIVCLITSLFGGRPGMISGATGAMAVVMTSLVVQHGIQYLFAAVDPGRAAPGRVRAACGWGKFVHLIPLPVTIRVRQRPGPGHRHGPARTVQTSAPGRRDAVAARAGTLDDARPGRPASWPSCTSCRS